MTRRSYESVDGDSRTNADLVIRKIEIRCAKGSIEAAQLPSQPDFAIDQWQTTGNTGPRGQLEDGIDGSCMRIHGRVFPQSSARGL